MCVRGLSIIKTWLGCEVTGVYLYGGHGQMPQEKSSTVKIASSALTSYHLYPMNGFSEYDTSFEVSWQDRLRLRLHRPIGLL